MLYKGVIVSAGACAVESPGLGGPGGSPIPPTPPLLGPKPKLEDLRTPSGFAAWGSFCGAHSMTRCAVITANIAKLSEPGLFLSVEMWVCRRKILLTRAGVQ